MKRLMALGCLGLVGLFGCDPPRPTGAPDELTIVVQADRRELDAQEKALRSREEALKSEQQQLDSRIKELAQSRSAADLEHRQRLDTELERAKGLQDELGLRVQKLQQQKAAMEVQRSVLAVPGGAQQSSAVSVRESMVAAREARLSAREAALAQREAEVALREKALAQRREEPPKIAQPAVATGSLLGGAVEQAVAREIPTREAIEARHKRLLAEMGTRGILVSDLPGEAQPLNADVFAARRRGDYARAADLLGELARGMQQLRVDQRFVEAKMVRLQTVRASARLGEGQKGEVEQLLRDVTSSYSDGLYEKANRGLNRIAAILDASGASG